ncbi:hypothetical protein HK097_008804 [Rhizophlyctis rosea]|uniref:Small-subunit processome Utp12 domain-containing protein n=1 Tax=Rhizophlyctis rosea TaxID=64517 RepID=A0AAD5SJB3_9FUNG|nr:hypothetical protein HK097_008804 [Rhizophlyctis rosea]
MVKLYLRYQLETLFGIVASNGGNIAFDAAGKFAIAPALENVNVWDLKKGTLLGFWRDGDNKAEVTCICRSPNGDQFAVGYSDGSIRLWSLETGLTSTTFNGHRSSITALSYDPTGSRLASGSKDTEIIIWDIIAESGLHRLRGHKDQITSLRFLTSNSLNHLLSTSKDTLLKAWDLGTQHCVETIVAHRSEVWALDVTSDERTMVTGAADGEVRVWSVDLEVLAKKLEPAGETITGGGADGGDGEGEVKRTFTLRGNLERQSKERVLTLKVHPNGPFVGIQGADKLVELYKIRTEEELKRVLARRKRRIKEKNSNKPSSITPTDSTEEDPKLTAADEIPRISGVRCSAKVRSFDFAPSLGKDGNNVQLVCALSNNVIEVQTMGTEKDAGEGSRMLSSIEMSGHRSDVRTLALSSDDELLVTGSNDMIKIWNTRSKQCLKTMESGYALCSSFLPGNNHVVIGTKTGELQIFDLARSTMIENIKAHEGPVWTLQMRPDRKGLTTGSQDKDVKFWDLAFIEDAEYSKLMKRPTLLHTRTLKMSDDVLCIRHSPDGQLLAISLLDSTVKILYFDTLKFFLSLYGHKLPVMSMDISSDSTMIVTGSSDKSLKIWGLDFGDCRKSLLAHGDAVMGVGFVWGTHYCFSVGKDRAVKYWDCDKFEQIMKLEGHHGEIWALAVGKYGNMIVTGSHDRSIRLWEKTEEQFALEEERERELEDLFDSAAIQEDRHDQAIGSGAVDAEFKEEGRVDEVGVPGKKTAETLKAGEKVIEALDVWEEERGAFDTYERVRKSNPDLAPPSRHPLVLATGKPDLSPEGFVLHVVERIRSSDLEEALLVLPFVKVVAMLKCLVVWTEKSWNAPLTSRILFFLLHQHHNQLVSTLALRPTLASIKKSVHSNLNKYRDRVGYNLAGLRYLRREWEGRHNSEFFGEPPKEIEEEKAVEGYKGRKAVKRNRVKVVS